MNLYHSLATAISETIPDIAAEDLQFAPPPNTDAGDVALRTFVAAKNAGIAPPVLAGRIASEVSFGSEVSAVEVSGPYVNFRLDRAAFAKRIVTDILNEGEDYGATKSGAGQQVLIEHTSINPNASPHVGRARNAMYGDTLARLFRFDGYDVEVHYYVNDMGRQIGLLVLYCDDLSSMTFDDVLEAYVAANAKAEADEAFAEAGYALLARMEQGDPSAAEGFREVVDLCLEGQLSVLARLDIQYDAFDYESSLLKDSRLESISSKLEETGAVFTDEDNRLVVDLAKLGHEREEGRFFVLRRANGSSMYGLRDLAYNLLKSDAGREINIQVFGEDHKLYAEQLALILRAAGYDPPETVYYAYVLLNEGKMSTRQGTVVLLSEFLDEATRRSRAIVEQQCADLPESERATIAQEVAVAAVRFAMLKVNPNKNVTFEWESSLSFTGDTGPYVQYSCARIHSILRKFKDLPEETGAEVPLASDAEWALVSKLASFSEVISGAVAQRNPAPIARFALEVAGLFTTFYHECPVLNAETEALRNARGHLCKATLQTLSNALRILGIRTLERM